MAEVEKTEVYIGVEVQQKLLKQALELTMKLTAELKELKKAGADISIIADQEGKIKSTLKTVEQIKNIRKEEAKIQKDALPFGIKKLELSKLELQRAKALLKEEQNRMRDAEKAASADEKAAAKQDALNQKRLAQEKKIQEALERENELLSREALTIAEIEEKNRILVKQRKNMVIATHEESEAFQEITLQIRANQERLNAFNEDIGRHQGSVGNYLKVWDGVGGALGGVSAALGNVKTAAMTLMANPAMLSLGALVLTIVALGKAFMHTSGGMKLMNKVAAISSAAFSTMTKAADAVANAFSSWDSFVDTMKDIGKGILSLSTAKGWADLISNISGVAKEVDKVYEAELNLINSRRNLEYATLGYNKAISELTAKQELLSAQVDADSLSFKETEKIQKELIATTEALTAAKLNLANENLKIANSDLKLRQNQKLSADELLPFYQKQAEAQQAVTDAQSQYAQVVFDTSEKIAKRKMDEADLDLDILIDGFDNRKTILEKELKLVTTTSDRRKEIIAELRKSNEDNTAAEVAIMQKFAKHKIDLDALMNESDERKVTKMIKDTEITERMGVRLLDVYRERRTVISDLNEAETEANKLNAEATQKKYDDAIKLFEQENELRALKLEQETLTEDEKVRLALERETALLEAKLSTADQYSIAISDIERKLLEQQISNNKKVLSDTTKTEKAKMKLRQMVADNALGLITEILGAESKAGKVSFAIQKGVALSGAIMDSKAAILKAWASAPFPANLPAVATTVLSTTPLVSAISSFGGALGGAFSGGASGGGGGVTTPIAPVPSQTLGQTTGVTPAQDNAVRGVTASVTIKEVPVLILPDLRDATATADKIEAKSAGA